MTKYLKGCRVVQKTNLLLRFALILKNKKKPKYASKKRKKMKKMDNPTTGLIFKKKELLL